MNPAAGVACRDCRDFVGDPHALESASRGLGILSSAFNAISAHDGICSHHDRYVARSSTCRDFRQIEHRVDGP
jgi:hypothetical protein